MYLKLGKSLNFRYGKMMTYLLSGEAHSVHQPFYLHSSYTVNHVRLFISSLDGQLFKRTNFLEKNATRRRNMHSVIKGDECHWTDPALLL